MSSYKLDNLEGTVTVTDLKAAEINAIDIVVKYIKDGEVFQRTFESKTVHLDQSFGLYEPQLPTTFEVTSEEVDNTLKITITVDDLDELISKMALVNTTENTFLYLTKENATTWTYTYENLTANSEVKFNVYYETSINSNKNFLKDSYTFSYIGKVEEPDNTTTQNTTTQEKNENNNSSKCSSKEKISVSDIILTILSVIGLNGLLVLLLKRK